VASQQEVEPLDEMRRSYRQRDAVARSWRAAGGRVVGYVCDNVPAELIRAAGFLPYRLSGDHQSSREQIAERIVPYHARRFAGAEFIEAIFAGIVAGQYDFLDYLVVPHNRKIVATLMQSVENLRPHRPPGALPEVHFLDRTYTRSFLASAYNRNSLRQLVTRLEQWSGRPLDREELQAVVASANQTRALLRELNALRCSREPRVSGSEALEIIGACHYLPVAGCNALLADFLQAARHRRPLPGVRIYLGGSPWDHPQFYQLVESAGAVIVAEDHCWGARCADLMLDGDPFDAIAERFAQQAACSMLGSLSETVQAVARRAAASGAQAAIFAVIQGDQAQMWETPSEVEALQELGIPALHLRNQPYGVSDRSAVQAAIAEFLAALPPAADR
jgi:benzoyl-CoA reductase/2-hydroxyglutaryl-CoA dehydratase subunit BcrC/BadD/HgdB